MQNVKVCTLYAVHLALYNLPHFSFFSAMLIFYFYICIYHNTVNLDVHRKLVTDVSFDGYEIGLTDKSLHLITQLKYFELANYTCVNSSMLVM